MQIFLAQLCALSVLGCFAPSEQAAISQLHQRVQAPLWLPTINAKYVFRPKQVRPVTVQFLPDEPIVNDWGTIDWDDFSSKGVLNAFGNRHEVWVMATWDLQGMLGSFRHEAELVRRMARMKARQTFASIPSPTDAIDTVISAHMREGARRWQCLGTT